MTRFLIPILGWVVPIVLAPLVYAMARTLLNVSRRVDDLPPFAKRLVVIALSVLLVAAFNVLGIAVPVECYAGDVFAFSEQCVEAINAPTVVKGITAALTAMVIHAIKKSRPND